MRIMMRITHKKPSLVSAGTSKILNAGLY